MKQILLKLDDKLSSVIDRAYAIYLLNNSNISRSQFIRNILQNYCNNSLKESGLSEYILRGTAANLDAFKAALELTELAKK